MIQAKALCAAIGANQVLRDVSLEIAPGELFAVIGANGAGKTSLLRALSGLLPLQSGAITFEGRNIARVPAHQQHRASLLRCGRRPLLVHQAHRSEDIGARGGHIGAADWGSPPVLRAGQPHYRPQRLRRFRRGSVPPILP